MARIYTTYFSHLHMLPKHIVPISICIKAPAGYEGLQYKKLAPNWSILSEYKAAKSEQKYREQFDALIIDKLNPREVLKELAAMSQGNDVALVCYERPDAFCHRHIIAKWLSGFTKQPIEEFR